MDRQRMILSDQVELEFQTCYSNFLTVMLDTKEDVRQAYEIMKEGSKTIYQMEATPYRSCRGLLWTNLGFAGGS